MSVDLGEYDIAIIGLGVAGSNLAALLNLHLKVIAVDKKDIQGHCNDEHFHKPCGGLLSQGAQKAFAMQGLNLPNTLLANPQIFAINTIDWHYPYASYIQKAYINMERHRFDLWLKSLIPPHIHTFHKAYFKRIEQKQGFYTIYFTQEQDSQHISYHCNARLVIGADGAKSHIRRWLYPQLKIPSLVCIQEWFKESTNSMLSCIFDKELSPSYSWSMSKDEYFIFTMLILLIYEHGGDFHLLISFSISFFRDLRFLSYRSFTCLVRVTPKYVILFVTIVKGVISLISFSAYLSFE